MKRFGVSYQIDARDFAHAVEVARDVEVFRAANVVVEQLPMVVRSGMRWSLSLTPDPARTSGWREVVVAFSGAARRGAVSLSDGQRDETCVLTPGQLAELIRGVALFPLDLLDAMASDDYRRRQLGGGHGG